MTELVRLDQAALDLYAAGFNASQMMRQFGFRLSFPNAAHVRLDLDTFHEGHRGGMGTDAINGGILAAMFDFALGNTSMLAPPLRRNATVQLSFTFERAVTGAAMHCEARIDRAASHMLFSSAEITDDRGNICARASGIVSMGREITLEEWTAKVSRMPGGSS